MSESFDHTSDIVYGAGNFEGCVLPNPVRQKTKKTKTYLYGVFCLRKQARKKEEKEMKEDEIKNGNDSYDGPVVCPANTLNSPSRGERVLLCSKPTKFFKNTLA